MTAEEILYNEYVSRYENGKKEGILQIAKEMLKEKMSIEQISKITKLKKEEIEKIVV